MTDLFPAGLVPLVLNEAMEEDVGGPLVPVPAVGGHVEEDHISNLHCVVSHLVLVYVGQRQDTAGGSTGGSAGGSTGGSAGGSTAGERKRKQ